MDAEFDEFLKNFDSWQVHLLIASFSIFLLLSQTPHWHAMNHIQYELLELSQLLSRKDLAIGSSHGESTNHAIPWFLILCLHFGLKTLLVHPLFLVFLQWLYLLRTDSMLEVRSRCLFTNEGYGLSRSTTLNMKQSCFTALYISLLTRNSISWGTIIHYLKFFSVRFILS